MNRINVSVPSKTKEEKLNRTFDNVEPNVCVCTVYVHKPNYVRMCSEIINSNEMFSCLFLSFFSLMFMNNYMKMVVMNVFFCVDLYQMFAVIRKKAKTNYTTIIKAFHTEKKEMNSKTHTHSKKSEN